MVIQVKEVLVDEQGGPGFGNFNHKGVEGKRGGRSGVIHMTAANQDKVQADLAEKCVDMLQEKFGNVSTAGPKKWENRINPAIDEFIQSNITFDTPELLSDFEDMLVIEIENRFEGYHY